MTNLEEHLSQALTVPALIAWLETQEPKTTYRYSISDDCLIARYLIDSGFNVHSVSNTFVCIGSETLNYPIFNLPWELNNISFPTEGVPTTYENALIKAKKYLLGHNPAQP